jgi:hypothetical protein
MNEPDGPICWMVLAPIPAGELARFAVAEWARRFPHAVDPPPWSAVAGNGEYAALVCRQAGAEGKDRPFAEHASRIAGDRAVYSLWLDPERAEIFEWRNGGETRTLPHDPSDFAGRLGVAVEREAPAQDYRVAVVEGASVGEVRAALGSDADEEWLRIDPGPAGVLITSTDGAIGTQAWDVAEALPDATVYLVQRWPDREEFEVRVLRGTEDVGVFAIPRAAGDTQPAVDEIRGARTPAAIAAALGIPLALLGLDPLSDP